MNEVTRILDLVAEGDTEAGKELLPMAYLELKRIAANQMKNEREGHTLQPTALVHEAYLRLAGPDGKERDWKSRGHFFSAAAEAMRRILIDHARKKSTLKRAGDQIRTTWNEEEFEAAEPSERVLLLNEALDRLEEQNPEFARIVKLHYFAGLSIPETAAALEVSPSTIDRKWRAAKTWLYREISRSEGREADKIPEDKKE